MPNQQKIYTGLCILFSVIIVMGNLIYQKFVSLPLLPFHTFELSVGAILYPLSFLITDLIAEFYGKARAQFCVRFAMVMNIFAAMVIWGMEALPAAEWSKIDNVIFHQVFGLYSVAFIGSIMACYIAQVVDIRLYLWIRKLTKGKWLWLRNNLSTAVSLLIDTCIVISFMTLFNILPAEKMGILIANSYMFKLFFVICSTPLFYIGFTIIKWLISDERNHKPAEKEMPVLC